MSPRKKIKLYVQVYLVVAAIAGVLTESWLAFGLTFVVLLGCAVGDGAIRLRGRTVMFGAARNRTEGAGDLARPKSRAAVLRLP